MTAELLTPAELSATLRTPEKTLAHWRQAGSGPRFLKVGGRRVLYRASDVEAWLESRARQTAGGAA